LRGFAAEILQTVEATVEKQVALRARGMVTEAFGVSIDWLAVLI